MFFKPYPVWGVVKKQVVYLAEVFALEQMKIFNSVTVQAMRERLHSVRDLLCEKLRTKLTNENKDGLLWNNENESTNE